MGRGAPTRAHSWDRIQAARRRRRSDALHTCRRAEPCGETIGTAASRGAIGGAGGIRRRRCPRRRSCGGRAPRRRRRWPPGGSPRQRSRRRWPAAGAAAVGAAGGPRGRGQGPPERHTLLLTGGGPRGTDIKGSQNGGRQALISSWKEVLGLPPGCREALGRASSPLRWALGEAVGAEGLGGVAQCDGVEGGHQRDPHAPREEHGDVHRLRAGG